MSFTYTHRHSLKKLTKNQRILPTLGVPTTSRILTGDSHKLSFSTLTKIPFLIFWSDKPPRHANSARVACSRAGTWAAWAEVARRQGVSYIYKIYIFEILIVWNIHHPAKSDEIFLIVGTNILQLLPTLTDTHMFADTHPHLPAFNNTHYHSLMFIEAKWFKGNLSQKSQSVKCSV